MWCSFWQLTALGVSLHLSAVWPFVGPHQTLYHLILPLSFLGLEFQTQCSSPLLTRNNGCCLTSIPLKLRLLEQATD